MALIGVKADGHRLQEIARQIAAFEEVIYLAITAGTYNFLVEVTCIDNAHLLALSDRTALRRRRRARGGDVYLPGHRQRDLRLGSAGIRPQRKGLRPVKCPCS